MTTAEGTASAGSSSASHRMTDELASDANRLKHTAAERAKQEADVRKVDAARAAKSASSALDKADAELDRDANAPRWLTAAGSIERLASNVEGRSTDELGREVSRFARDHPGAFLAASAAAGFAAARFLRAGADYQHHHQQQNQGGYGAETSAQAAPAQFAGQGGMA